MDRRRVTPRPQARGPRLDLDDVVYGIHAVDEALVAGEPLKRIHVGDERKRDPALRNLLERAREAGVTVRFENRGFFASFPYKAHQSVVAFGEPFAYITIEEAIALRPQSTPGLWVILDHVTDPHNVGAIIRTAECAGATALILPDRRSAGVNGTVRKAAAGAALGEGSVPYTQADFNRDLAIVIGAEGAGIAQLVRKECDYLVAIPLAGQVGSLNASVAAGILLFEAVRQRAAR